MQFLNWEVVVEVDGVPLPEYEVKFDEKENTATCWIPSQAGKSFSIAALPLKQLPHDTTFDFFADGLSLGGQICSSTKRSRAIKQDIRVSATTTRSLQFSTIQLTDRDDEADATDMQHLGSIKVEVWHLERTPCKPRVLSIRKLQLGAKIHEKSKKAMAHRVGLGEETHKEARPKKHVTKRISKLSTFLFKYRGLDVLKADGIAPPDPTPHVNKGKRKATEPDEEKEDTSSSDEDDDGEEDMMQQTLKGLMESVRMLESTLSQRMAKKEKKKSKSKSSKKVKAEHSSQPKLFNPGEIIDLT